MKKLLIGVAAVGVLLIAAVLIAPSFIDWNAHKKQIAALVRDATGRDLLIRGNIDVTILPSPAIRVEDVRLASVAGAVSPEMVRLPEARISVAFAPLLEGRLAAVVTLIRPTVNLERLSDGRVNWEFAAQGGAGASSTGGASGEASARGPFDVKLDSFRIVDGTVSYHDAMAETVERIEKLNSEVSFDSLDGPFRIDGEAKVRGVPIAVKASTGVMKPNQPLSVVADLSISGTDSTLHVNGLVSDIKGEPTAKGDLEIKAESLAVLLTALLGSDAPATLAQPTTVQAGFSASKQDVALNAVEIEFGTARASGEVKAAFDDTATITASVRTGNLNLDALLDGAKKPAPETPRKPQNAGESEKAVAKSSSPQVKTADSGAFVLPAITVLFKADANIVQYNGALVRDLSAFASLKDGRIAVENVSAVLPGSTSFGVKGSIAAVDGQPDMALDVTGRSDNLREMIEWLGVDTAAIPADRLRRFAMSAKVTGAPSNLTVRDIGVQLDASKLSGGLALVMRDRPAFGLRLVVDRINVDGYLAGRDAAIRTTPQSPQAATESGASAPQAGPIAGLADALQFLETFDANIDATVKNFIVARTPASDLSLDVTILNGGLQVKRLSIGDLAGARGSLSGTLDRSKEQPAVVADYSVEIVDVPRFARFADSPALLAHRGEGRLASSGKIEGNLDQLAVDAKVDALGAVVAINGGVTSLLKAPAFKLATSIRAPELVHVVRLLKEDYGPAAGKLGPVDLSFQLDGSQTHVSAESITGHAGPVALHGSAGLTLEGPRPKLTAAIETSEVSLDLFLPPESRRRSEAPVEFRIIPAAVSSSPGAVGARWSGKPIDAALLEAIDADIKVNMSVLAKDPYRFRNSKLSLQLNGGKLTLDPFQADFSTGTVVMTGALAPDKDQLAGTLKLDMNSVDVSDLVDALKNYQVNLGPIRFGAKMRGPVTVSGGLNTRGASERDLISGLAGAFRITGQLRTDMSSETRQASAVAGLAGALLGNKVKEIRGVTDAVQGTDLLISAFEGPSTLNGDITAANGVFVTRNLVLVGRGGRALTAGTANLPGWTLDSVTDVTLGQDTEPYVTAQVAGALDDPYLRKVSGTLLRGRPVSNTPSTGQTPQTGANQPVPKIYTPQEAEQPAPAAKKVKPEDVLKGLLQGLSR